MPVAVPADLVHAAAVPRERTGRALENGDPVATLDHDAPTVFEESAEIARRRVTGP